MNRLHTPIAPDIRVETRGEVSLAAPDYARAKLLAVVERQHEPAVVDLNGRPVRAHVAAATMQEAVDLLQDRLTARLARVHRHRDAHRLAVAGSVAGPIGEPEPGLSVSAAACRN
ncbi:hypothetical protein [Kitasatospora sp. NPDC085464]|uniref:hypothetical protein n=1 Tax=Kitasatospora sp. NPDC085464 TaxID=3364063 RepID=UPI0037CBB085